MFNCLLDTMEVSHGQLKFICPKPNSSLPPPPIKQNTALPAGFLGFQPVPQAGNLGGILDFIFCLIPFSVHHHVLSMLPSSYFSIPTSTIIVIFSLSGPLTSCHLPSCILYCHHTELLLVLDMCHGLTFHLAFEMVVLFACNVLVISHPFLSSA